jgi:type IV pilus biogenesis protein PilP
MAKPLSSMRAVIALTLSLGALQASAQSFADQSNEIQAQIQILEQRRMLNEALQKAADPLLSSMPRVLSILGMENDLSARLILANGTVSNFRVGEVIRGSMTVAAITPRSVLVKFGKKKNSVLALEFVAGATTGSPGAGAAGASVSGSRVGQSMPVPVELLPAPPRVNLAPAPIAAPASPGATPASSNANPAPGPAVTPVAAGAAPQR